MFTGIGGLDLAAEAAGFVTVGQVEYADYPTKVLEKNFPNVERWRDVREFTAVDFRERTGYSTVDVLSGGFPCQPHSLAGKRLASLDERDLWGEMRRIGWPQMLHDGFRECFRVLKPDGVLIFKWSESDIPAEMVWKAIGQKPLFGHHSGKQSKTFWGCYIKLEASPSETGEK